MTPQDPQPQQSILVDASTDVGSAVLARALESADPAAIGRALRHDYVVVPVIRTATGELQTSVTRASETSDADLELCLFSSAKTYSMYLGDITGGEFSLQRGTSIGGFIRQHRERLARVTFDAAGPFPMTATPDDVLAVLDAQPDDDEVAWITDAPDAAAPPALADASRVSGFDLPLSGDWFAIAVDDEERRRSQIDELLAKQLGGVTVPVPMRNELARWLTEACVRAAAGGAQFMAYLLQRNDRGALALNVTLYWHELGPSAGVEGHLDAVGRRLKAELAPDARLSAAETPGGPLIRHSRIGAGSGELGAADIPLLLVDYWLEFPDKRGLCLVSFSTPHVELHDTMLTIADNIILGGAWIIDTPAE